MSQRVVVDANRIFSELIASKHRLRHQNCEASESSRFTALRSDA